MKDLIKKILREQISTELEQDLNAFHPDLFELEEGRKKKKKKKKKKRRKLKEMLVTIRLERDMMFGLLLTLVVL